MTVDSFHGPDAALPGITAIPSRYRVYSQSADDALSVHRISGELLRELIAQGLPYVGSPEAALFDERDLANVSARLGLRSAWFFGQKRWPAALAELRGGESAEYELGIKPRCPYPGHAGACEFGYLLGERSDDPEPTAGAVGHWAGPDKMTVRAPGGYQTAGPTVAAVLACLDDAEYVHLPDALDSDLSFFDRTGLANCVLAARVLLREARRQGVEARPSFGLILLAPYAGLHSWVEFSVGGHWTAFDPHLVKFLERARVLEEGAWPRFASLSGLFLRLGAREVSLATHGASQAELSFRVKRVP